LITRSSELSKLDPFMSADVRHASMMTEQVRQFKSPVTLLKRNNIVNLIIRHVHNTYWNYN